MSSRRRISACVNCDFDQYLLHQHYVRGPFGPKLKMKKWNRDCTLYVINHDGGSRDYGVCVLQQYIIIASCHGFGENDNNNIHVFVYYYIGTRRRNIRERRVARSGPSLPIFTTVYSYSRVCTTDPERKGPGPVETICLDDRF